MIVWLASDASDGFNGCRFVADRWDPSLPSQEAALGCQESQIFPTGERDTPQESVAVTAWSLRLIPSLYHHRKQNY